MGKQILVYLYNGILSTKKRNDIFMCISMNHKIIMLSERLRQERICIIWLHLHRILENEN